LWGRRVVQLDRRRGSVRDEAGVVEKFGVVPVEEGYSNPGRKQKFRMSQEGG
jgi:hypothetical protein